MKLFTKSTLTTEERKSCLLYHDEELKVAAFLDREYGLFSGALAKHQQAMTERPQAAGEVCRASDRFRQAAEEAFRRHAALEPIPTAATKFYGAASFYFLHLSAWAKTNQEAMETLARGMPPFYVQIERLEKEAESAWQQMKETYRSFRARLGLPGDRPDIFEAAIRSDEFKEMGADAWKPEPYISRPAAESGTLAPQLNASKAVANTTTHSATAGANRRARVKIDLPDEAAPVDGPDATAWYKKGCSLTALSRHEEAADCYDKALEMNPQDAGSWFNKGVSLAALGRREEAIACYDKAIEIDPRDAIAWFNKGVNLAALDRREEAIACFDKALEIDARDATTWCAKGINLAALGQREDAIGCWDRALAIDTQCVARARSQQPIASSR